MFRVVAYFCEVVLATWPRLATHRASMMTLCWSMELVLMPGLVFEKNRNPAARRIAAASRHVALLCEAYGANMVARHKNHQELHCAMQAEEDPNCFVGERKNKKFKAAVRHMHVGGGQEDSFRDMKTHTNKPRNSYRFLAFFGRKTGKKKEQTNKQQLQQNRLKLLSTLGPQHTSSKEEDRWSRNLLIRILADQMGMIDASTEPTQLFNPKPVPATHELYLEMAREFPGLDGLECSSRCSAQGLPLKVGDVVVAASADFRGGEGVLLTDVFVRVMRAGGDEVVLVCKPLDMVLQRKTKNPKNKI